MAYVSVAMWQQDVNVQSRHVQANCKFQVQQCKEGVSLLGQILFAPTSGLDEIDMRIFSSPCYIHICQAGLDDHCFHVCVVARKVLYPDSQKEIFQDHPLLFRLGNLKIT